MLVVMVTKQLAQPRLEERIKGFTNRQQEFLAVLNLVRDVHQARRLVTMHQKTFWKWKREDAFSTAMDEVQLMPMTEGFALLLKTALEPIARQLIAMATADWATVTGEREKSKRWAIQLILMLLKDGMQAVKGDTFNLKQFFQKFITVEKDAVSSSPVVVDGDYTSLPPRLGG